MPKQKTLTDLTNLPPVEKHPLEKPPLIHQEIIITEDDLDRIPDEEEEETPGMDKPVPGEGPL